MIQRGQNNKITNNDLNNDINVLKRFGWVDEVDIGERKMKTPFLVIMSSIEASGSHKKYFHI